MPWKCPSCGYDSIPDDVDTCPVCGFVKGAEAKSEEKAKPQAPPEAPKQPEVTPKPTTLPTKAKVVIVQTSVPELKGKEFELPFDVFPVINIGRSPENVICIPDPYVSRLHAKIHYEGGKFLIEDVGSTNGTYIYDKSSGLFKKIGSNTKLEIDNGTLIKLGLSTIIKFVLE